MTKLLTPEPKRLCQQCGGILVLQGHNKFETTIERADGVKESVTRYQEEWHCHHGHKFLRNVMR